MEDLYGTIIDAEAGQTGTCPGKDTGLLTG